MEPTDLAPPAPPAGLAARARAAYRRGRVWLAGRRLLVALSVPAGALLLERSHGPLALTGDLGLALCSCIAFLAAVPIFAFFGRAPGDAVAPGLGAAVLATWSPLLMRSLGHACASTACMSLCLPACVVGGAAAGLVLSLRARAQPTAAERTQTLLAGGALVLLAAPLGCTMFGLSGLVAVAAGLAVGSVPVLAPRTAP